MSRTNDVNIAMQYAKSGVDGVHLMDSHKATIGWVVNTLAAEVERLEAFVDDEKGWVARAEAAEADRDKWYGRCASLVWRVPSSVTAGEIQQWEADYKTELAKAEARVRELEAQLNKRIDAYMNEPHCCSGRECGCMGVTRFEQIVGEELGQRMATMREKNARLRAALVRLDNIYRSELDGEDAPKRPAWLIAALNSEEAST